MGKVRLLKASAGSGKTFRLAYHYVKTVIQEPMNYRHILAVTFTNKATEEMKRRILSEINDLAVGRQTAYLSMLEKELPYSHAEIEKRAATARSRILHDYSHFSILTIDKFFQRVIRSFIKELGMDLDFSLELQTDSLLSSASDMLIDELSVRQELREWVAAFVEERIEENRKWDIKEGLMELGTEIFRERYRYISSGSHTMESLKKIVDKAVGQATIIKNCMKAEAAEALNIMASAGLSTSDFSGGTNSFANYFRKIAEGKITAYGASVSKAIESDDKWYAKTSVRKHEIIDLIPQLRPLLSSICECYDHNISFLNTVDILRRNYRAFGMLTDLAAKVEQVCAAGSIMPISETNVILNKLISGNDTPFIFEKAGNHYSYYMIDEFQDTSTMQWENFVPLLENAVSQSPESPVLVVGDVKQSIYRWRGGDWRILGGGVEKAFPGAETEVLMTNFRSLRNIIAFNNAVVEACVKADDHAMDNELDAALDAGMITAETYTSLKSILSGAYTDHRQQGSESKTGGYIDITVYGESEPGVKPSAPVIERIVELQQRGYRPENIAILVRYNADGVKIANEILEYKSRNPQSPYSFDVVTQEALKIGASKAVNFVVAVMKLSYGIKPGIELVLYNQWLGRNIIRMPDEKEAEALRQIRLLSPEEAFEQIISVYGLGTADDDTAYLQAFHEQIIGFQNSNIADISLFVKWWEETGKSQSINIPGASAAITIISIHKAKGLQYKAVIIPYCNWSLNPNSRTMLWAEATGSLDGLGKVPVGYSERMKNSAFANEYFTETVLSHVDNINTFYVATTRAMEELHIMMPRQRIKPDRIDGLILQSIAVSDKTAILGDMVGQYEETESRTVYRFGEPVCPRQDSKNERAEINVNFSSFPIDDRLRLKLKTDRYTADGNKIKLTSPREYGIMMHSVFENIGSIDDVPGKIARMAADGNISPAEAAMLTEKLQETLSEPTVAEWFSAKWEVVRNENEIILPGGSTSRRPDRVMIRGCEAVVVDYKFGLGESSKHRRQIEEYISLLRQMGFTKIRGYIWYIPLARIVEVVPDLSN